jgi:ABC-type uncharacterized transport system permease subunit
MRLLDKMVKEINTRYLDLLKANLFIMFQSMKEYKSNLYSVFLIQIVFVSISYFIMFLIASNFGDVIGWSYLDFIIYTALIKMITQAVGFFIWGNSISASILSGSLNTHLLRPTDIKFQYYFSNLSSSAFIFFIFSVLEVIILLLFFDSNFQISLFFLLIIFLLFVYQFLFFQVIETLGFYYKQLDQQILKLIYPINSTLSSYPIDFFNKMRFKEILFIIVYSLLALLLFPSTYHYDKNMVLLITLMLIVVFFVIFTLNWKNGLKKYEAFG